MHAQDPFGHEDGKNKRKSRKKKSFAKPGNERIYDRNIKMIKLGDKVVPINAEMAEMENNMAAKQCQDNNQAYYMFKQSKLFPKKIGYSAAEIEKQKNKQMVQAYKLLQESVQLRNIRWKNNKKQGDPPLEYPTIKQQIKEKKKLRKMYNDLMMNTYLEHSDSDLSEHDSVASDKIKYYESKYN